MPVLAHSGAGDLLYLAPVLLTALALSWQSRKERRAAKKTGEQPAEPTHDETTDDHQ